MSEVFRPYSENEAQEEAEKMESKIASGEALNYDEAEKIVDKERIKENLKRVLEDLQGNFPGFINDKYYLVNANIPEVLAIARDFQCIGLSEAAQVVLETDEPGAIFHMPGHLAHDYLNKEYYKEITDGIDGKWHKIGKLLVMIRAAQRADNGFYSGEDISSAAEYYRGIGMIGEAEEMETMQNDPKDFNYKTCSEAPYVGKAVAEFRKEVREEDLLTPEEIKKIRVDAIEKIEKILADLEK